MAFSTSTRKEDVSIKLRAQNMKNTHEITRQLEVESRKMEERLQELKLAMNREKEERAQRGGGFWQSGQEGKMGSAGRERSSNKSASTKENREKGSAKKTKIKVLKDAPIVTPERKAVPGTIAHIAKRSPVGSRTKGPKCGQCEQKAANVSCQECGEDYCASCFASFHLKGALRKHRSVPVGSNGLRTPRPTIPTGQPADVTNMSVIARPLSANRSASSADNPSDNDTRFQPSPPGAGSHQAKKPAVVSTCKQVASLLDGAYDEREQAAEFQKALLEWRQGKAASATASTQESLPGTKISDGTCTAPEQHAPVEIRFKQSLSYAEKLLLKRHRRTELESLIGDDYPILNGLDDDGPVDVGLPEVDLGSIVGTSSVTTARDDQEDTFRPDSRVSIIDLDETRQPRHSLRGLEQSSAYHVQEMPEGLDYYRKKTPPPESRAAFGSPTPRPPKSKPRTPTSGRRRHVKSPASDTDSTPVLDLKALNDYKEQSRIELQQQRSLRYDDNKENELSMSMSSVVSRTGSSSRNDLDKYYGRKKKPSTVEMKLSEDAQGARPKSKTGFVPRTKSRSGNRPTSRAASRTGSRAASRFSISGEGLLTKGPSEGLRDIARLAGGVSYTPAEPMRDLGGFFTAGVQGKPEEDVPSTPRPASSRMGSARPASGRESRQEAKWKVSYKTYQMAPRSWKPDNSLGITVSDSQMALQLEQGAKDVMNMLGTDQTLPPEENNVVREATMSFSLTGTSVVTSERPPSTSTSRRKEPASISSSINSQTQRSESRTGRKSVTKSQNDQGASGGGHPVKPSSAKSRSRPGTPRTKTPNPGERPLSRAVVVDGDDMSKYDDDDELVALEEDADDNEALNQLEWELASQDGRITADGNMSRMSMLEGLTEEEMDLGVGSDDGRNTGLSTPDPTLNWDEKLRESVLMGDFDDMEKQCMQEDEDDVRGLH